MQKALCFASALSKGSYAFNGFGHTITVDDFFEAEEAEPQEKKQGLLSQFPWQQEKTTSGHKGCQKTQLSTGTKAGTSSDPTYEPVKDRGMLVIQKVNQRMSYILL